MSVGYVVAFLCQSSMGRSGKGRVNSPVNNRAFGGAMKPQRLALKAQKSDWVLLQLGRICGMFAVIAYSNPVKVYAIRRKWFWDPSANSFSRPHI
jgi:hypothetical protein